MAQKGLRWSKIEECSRVYQSVPECAKVYMQECGKRKLALKGFETASLHSSNIGPKLSKVV